MDGVPSAFTFTDADANASTVTESNTVTISGIDTDVTASFSSSGGSDHEYSLNGGAWTAIGDVTVSPADTLQLRLTSEATALATAEVTVTIGGVLDTWTVTTAVSGGWKPLGSAEYWLRRIDVTEEIREIIEEVAEKQALKAEPPVKAPIAPLKTAIRRAEYQYKTNYAEIYREVYERVLGEMREDDEEALFLLM